MRLFLAPLALAPILAATPVQAQDASQAGEVLDRHLAAFGSGDVDAIMEDYTDSSVFITPDRVYEGKAEIRALFEQLVEAFSAPEASLAVEQRHVTGPIAYITWSGETADTTYALATDTLYVEDDSILYQTFAAETVAK